MTTPIADLPWLSVLVAVPVAAAALIWLVPGLQKVARPLALVVSLLVLAGAVAMVPGFDASGGYQFAESYSWIPAIGASWALGINGLGLVMILLAVALVPIVIAAAWNEVKPPTIVATVGTEGTDGTDGTDGVANGDARTKALDRRRAGYVALVLLLEAMMIAIFAVRDLFSFYVVFEAMLIPVYFMIGVFGGPNRRPAAIKFLLYSLAGGLVMLAGVIYLLVQTGGGAQALLLDNLAGTLEGNDTAQLWVFLSFLLAFAIKAPMVPVHTWLPDAASQAPPGTSALLVGVLDKVGTFAMIAICLPLFPDAVANAAPYLVVLAIISIIYGGILAIGQRDVMRLIAFTSVSHFGLIVLGIFVGTQTAMTGSMIYMVAHGVSTAALFLVAGFLTQRGGSQQMSAYSGMQRVVPVLAGVFLISGLATLALPGLSGFVPEYLVLLGSFEANAAAGVFAVVGVVLSALYILLAYQKIFTGPAIEDTTVSGLPTMSDLSARERWTMAPLVIAMIALGFFPGPVLDLLTPAADQFAAILGSAS
ncbi:NADH-quinone oxidoreductase subunit M [Ruania halotolerans]|uniref:NADH-quinone oxidoreductase subunit M n=1 Tax=Ruania halotolerans TaxID=2897773 RepID=UPI001E543157|nr:NADH-quinone oxidoreductase subunit M [Ruania halotolerans]UFU05796.1 NADH-quinone oxidoreductase subunit M [Ruania halotolerans]